ncbi:hypothetical protein uan_073 [Pseudomonas phage UAntarctica]|nr:hypothetical protein uan_073 [Pseudomonas phage UAntarctica]
MIDWDKVTEVTPEQESEAAAKLLTAKLYLADTAWYVTRQIETGEEVPEDIKAARLEAYAELAE